jgi:hypothetical protein
MSIPTARTKPAFTPLTRLVWNNAINPGPNDIVIVSPIKKPFKNAPILKTA